MTTRYPTLNGLLFTECITQNSTPCVVSLRRYITTLCCSGVFDNGKDPKTLLDDEDDISPEDEAIGMVIPDGFRLQESRPAALDNSLLKRGVLVRLGMGWFGGLITRKSQERTKNVYDYRVHLEADQSVRSMKLPLAAYSTENTAAVGAWVLLELNDAEQTGGTVGQVGQTSQPKGSEAGREIPSVSSRGRALRPNVRNVDRVG